MTTDNKQNNEIFLADFIKERKDLMSTLGMFAALSLFADNFIPGILGEGISFLFLLGFILLFLELWSTFPPQRGVTRLALFENVIVFTGLGITTYWFIKLWFFSIEYFISTLSLLITIPILNLVIVALRKIGVLAKLFSQIKKNDLRRFLFGLLLAAIVWILVSILIEVLIGSVRSFIDEIFRSFLEIS